MSSMKEPRPGKNDNRYNPSQPPTGAGQLVEETNQPSETDVVEQSQEQVDSAPKASRADVAPVQSLAQ
jgi:hypothetical protein